MFDSRGYVCRGGWAYSMGFRNLTSLRSTSKNHLLQPAPPPHPPSIATSSLYCSNLSDHRYRIPLVPALPRGSATDHCTGASTGISKASQVVAAPHGQVK